MLIPKTVKRIPYGIADYQKICAENLYYVDKTRFIPLLESSTFYTFLIRPRRFGKSLWVSVLENYYDINLKDRFDELFGNTWIGKNPTDQRNTFLRLTFNFSMVNPDIRFVGESFEDTCYTVIQDFLLRYEAFFTEKEQSEILSLPNTESRLKRILAYAARKKLKIYLFIDEYDNFANTILSTAGAEAYYELTHGPGFYRYFFNLLKGGTSFGDAGLTRLFITGVSPVTMDDVTSGFNIGKNISLDSRFNTLIGFRENEVREMLAYYRNAGLLEIKTDDAIEIMKQWYDNYCFSVRSEEKMFNSDMALYFIDRHMDENMPPRQLIDQNIRIYYGKLRHLIFVDRQMTLNENFSELKGLTETGGTACEISSGFPLEELKNRENFISLLFYFGLLTFGGTDNKDRPLLRIPNLTVRKLMYGYIRDAFKDVNVFRIDIRQFSELVTGMAYDGEWRPLFDFLAGEVEKQTSVRDYLEGEKVIQGFLLAYLNITDVYLTRPEQELNKGFTDLLLEPFFVSFPNIKFAYLIELKYIARGKFTEELQKEKINEAETHLRQYAADERIKKMEKRVTVKKLVVVYKGWEMVYCEEA